MSSEEDFLINEDFNGGCTFLALRSWSFSVNITIYFYVHVQFIFLFEAGLPLIIFLSRDHFLFCSLSSGSSFGTSFNRVKLLRAIGFDFLEVWGNSKVSFLVLRNPHI